MENDQHAHPGAAFVLAFGEDVRALFVRALRRAYATACELHDAKRGSDAQTFGFCVYKFAVFEIDNEAHQRKDVLTVATRNPLFRFVVRDFSLACHRVGESEHDDINVSFPGNDGAAAAMIEDQLWLEHVARGKALADARSVVLAHLGNAEDGLRAIYLCIPEEKKDGRISRWAYTELVWRADAVVATPTQTTVNALAPVEHVEAPKIVRRPRKVSDDTNG